MDISDRIMAEAALNGKRKTWLDCLPEEFQAVAADLKGRISDSPGYHMPVAREFLKHVSAASPQTKLPTAKTVSNWFKS